MKEPNLNLLKIVYKCKDHFLYINRLFVCDSKNDCPLGDDEENCSTAKYFLCNRQRKREKIPVKFVCDHKVDCSNLEDEDGCSFESCDTKKR